MTDLGHTALGSWSGGRHMHFGLPVDEDRLVAILRPDETLNTVVTADAYGQGAADVLVGKALEGLPRSSYRLAGTIGHDFYHGTREGSKGFPRFTDPRLRGPKEYRDYIRMAAENSLKACGVDHFDLLMLHNPDRVGYSSEVVWRAMADLRDEGLANMLGVAPGPANGYTLDVIGCLERFGELIDWTMLILNPFEPWPGRMALPACERFNVKVLARVVDYGGIFHGDVPDESDLPEFDHRAFRPSGWVNAGRERLAEVLPIAERHGLSPLQLSCQWTLAQPAVASVVPTLIQEPGADAKPIEEKRAELAAVPQEIVLSDDEIAQIAEVGENAGCMALKGGTPGHDGPERADSWPVDPDLASIAQRWSIDPEKDLVLTM